MFLQLDRNTVHVFCFLRISEFRVLVIYVIEFYVYSFINIFKCSRHGIYLFIKFGKELVRIVNAGYMRNKFLPAGTLFASRYLKYFLCK